jgi:hypothetical protein
MLSKVFGVVCEAVETTQPCGCELNTNEADSVKNYQDAFLTPGICPLYANSRKQIRQSWNLRYTECGRPHFSQRVYACVVNLAGRLFFAIIDFLAKIFTSYII